MKVSVSLDEDQAEVRISAVTSLNRDVLTLLEKFISGSAAIVNIKFSPESLSIKLTRGRIGPPERIEPIKNAKTS